MNTKNENRMDNTGVSPVIATILMVAITVVLAAVLYLMVSSFTDTGGTAVDISLTADKLSSTSYELKINGVTGGPVKPTTLKAAMTANTTSLGAAVVYVAPVWDIPSAIGANFTDVGGDGAFSKGDSIIVTGLTINNTGSGTAHENKQPYIVLNFIIKS